MNYHHNSSVIVLLTGSCFKRSIRSIVHSNESIKMIRSIVNDDSSPVLSNYVSQLNYVCTRFLENYTFCGFPYYNNNCDYILIIVSCCFSFLKTYASIRFTLICVQRIRYNFIMTSNSSKIPKENVRLRLLFCARVGIFPFVFLKNYLP